MQTGSCSIHHPGTGQAELLHLKDNVCIKRSWATNQFPLEGRRRFELEQRFPWMMFWWDEGTRAETGEFTQQCT